MLFGRLLWERWHIVVAPGERGESCGGPETLCASMLFIYLRPTDRRHAREFEVKGLSFRLKGQPMTTAEATLMGGDLFTFAGKWHNQ